jgi:four helix bundle protein
MKENIIADKTYNFAKNIVSLYRDMIKNQSIDEVILRQLLKSGTSIGANTQEAIGAFSRKEFIAKLQISYKEARETLYWLNLLTDTGIVDKSRSDSLISDCGEIIKIITSILKSSKERLNN